MIDMNFINSCGAQIVRFSECNLGAKISKELINSLGLNVSDKLMPSCLVDQMQEVQKYDAIKILTRMLYKDLAYDHAGDATELACNDFAVNWLEEKTESGVKYYTNGNWQQFWSEGQGGWSPLTNATFDGGIIAVHALFSRSLWFEAED